MVDPLAGNSAIFDGRVRRECSDGYCDAASVLNRRGLMLAVYSKSGRLCTLLSAEAWAVASVTSTNTLTRTKAQCPGTVS